MTRSKSPLTAEILKRIQEGQAPRLQTLESEETAMARREPPEGFERVRDPQYLRGIHGVTDGLEAANNQIRLSVRMLEVTHKLFPLPTAKYKKLRGLLNAASRAIQTSYPIEPCPACFLRGADPHTCKRCWGRGYLV
jgi:hypothetical protein